MITREDIEAYAEAGVIAAGRAFGLGTPMMHRLAKHLGAEFKTCTVSEQERRRQERAELAPKVSDLAAIGMAQREICQHLGISRAILRRIAEEHWIDIDNRSVCREARATAR